MKIAIIGAGIGGLATAIRLAVKGHSITVYEKNDYPGGKVSELYMDGYCFDTGPSLFTLPELTRELIRMCGEDPDEVLPCINLEVNCKYFFPDGTDFNFYHDKEKLIQEIKNKTTENPEKVLKWLDKAKESYEIGAPVFLFSCFHKWSNFNTPEYKGIVRELHKLDFFRTMHQAIRKHFSDEKLVRIFERYATYNGSNPYKAPATLNMIAHLENNIGAYFPKKGMYAIVDCLYNLALKQGVSFRFGEEVKEIIVKENQVKGIRTKEKTEHFDLVVSALDAKYVANNLLEHHPSLKRINKSEPSSSALIFYWCVDRAYPELELHNILFSENYKKEFDDIFRNKTITDDPTVYLFISSKVVKGDAPEGCENWFVMVNAPADSGQDWNQIVATTRENIIEKINKTFNTDIEKYICKEEVNTPLTIEKNTGSMGGALYGTSSNSVISAFLRHPNFIKKISGLYFVGGSVHPGGGIPLCLASAKIVEEEITTVYGECKKV